MSAIGQVQGIIDRVAQNVELADGDRQAVGELVPDEPGRSPVRVVVLRLQGDARRLDVGVRKPDLLEGRDDRSHHLGGIGPSRADCCPLNGDPDPQVGNVGGQDHPAGPAHADRVIWLRRVGRERGAWSK